ncbi:phosphatase PAP2 family protein [Azospirillum sp. sgz302134]
MLVTLSKAVTLLGSAPFVLPVSGVLTAVLWRRHSTLAAARWLTALALLVMAVLLLKVGGRACDVHLFDERMNSPSGHAALSAAVYGTAGVLASRHLDGWRRNGFLLAVFGVVAGVAVSRVTLHRHSVAEVLAGLALGGLAVAAFAQSLSRFAGAHLNLNPLAVAVVILFGSITVTLGDRSYAEPFLRHAVAFLHEESLLCGPAAPPSRDDVLAMLPVH